MKSININRPLMSNSTIFRQAVLFPLPLFLMACSLPMSNKNQEHRLQNDYSFFNLMAVPSNLQNRVWLDKFTISFEGSLKVIEPQSMLLQTELTEHSISIAAISFEGIPLAQANWNPKTQQIITDNSFDKNFNSKQVMHDIQSANWPLPQIMSSLHDGFTVTEEIKEDVNVRKFYRNNKMILRITTQANKINFNQIEQGYQIIIIRLEDNLLSTSVTADLKSKD